MKLKLLEKLGCSVDYVRTVSNWRQPNCAWDGAKSRTRHFGSKPPAAHAAAGRTKPVEAGVCSAGKHQHLWSPVPMANSKTAASGAPLAKKKPGHAVVVAPRVAHQAAPLRFCHHSARINVFLNERGRHCNDNRGGHTKLAWKCMADFLSNLPFCCATHLTFCSVAKGELSPTHRSSPHLFCCDTSLGLSSPTAGNITHRAMTAAQGKRCTIQGRKEPTVSPRSEPSLFSQAPERVQHLSLQIPCALVGRESKCDPAPR